MDFFQRQAAARRTTRWLLLAFLVALGCVVAAIAGIVSVVVAQQTKSTELGAMAAVLTAIVTLCIIGGASLFKSLELRAGGGVVARSLGGTRIVRGGGDVTYSRLINVVEEMAIAAGTPVPEIYVLEDEDGINAFAAGNSPADAAIAVTRGALRRLNREELQGVIGHEFSHVLNGDMRLNTRLLGWIFGFLVVAIAMRLAFEVLARTRSVGRNDRNDKNPLGAIILVALAVMALGYIGVFVGRLFQAAVARHRERLADASSVQFTRNPLSLAGALLKIAGLEEGSRLRSSGTESVAHMLFAPGLARVFATHPPIAERIAALDPTFKPAQLAARAAAAARSADVAAQIQPPALTPEPAPATAARTVAQQTGTFSTEHVAYAARAHAEVSAALRTASASPESAQAFVLAMLLGEQPDARVAQLAILERTYGAEFARGVAAASAGAVAAAPRARLTLVSLLFPTLKRLSLGERRRLQGAVHALALADSQLSVFECCLSLVLDAGLDDSLQARQQRGSRALADEVPAIRALFAILAAHGADDPAEAQAAYDAAAAPLQLVGLSGYAPIEDWPREFVNALGRLAELHPLAKRVLIEGLVRCIAHDQRLVDAEAELLRATCAVLGCPLPPLLNS